MNRLALLSLVIVAGVPFFACGGKLDTGDAGTGTDASSTTTTPTATVSTSPPSSSPSSSTSGNPPPTPSCSPITSSTNLSSTTCAVSASWTCGDTDYAVSCECQTSSPMSQCSCSQQTLNTGVGMTVPYAGCPGCSITSGTELAAICNFPTSP